MNRDQRVKNVPKILMTAVTTMYDAMMGIPFWLSLFDLRRLACGQTRPQDHHPQLMQTMFIIIIIIIIIIFFTLSVKKDMRCIACCLL